MTISLSDATVFASKAFVPGAKATARYELASDGSINKYVNGAKTNIGTWDNVSGTEGNYEVEATLTSGTLSGGLTGQWLSLDANPAWEEDETNAGTRTAVVSLTIRDKATHTTQAGPNSITLEASLFR